MTLWFQTCLGLPQTLRQTAISAEGSFLGVLVRLDGLVPVGFGGLQKKFLANQPFRDAAGSLCQQFNLPLARRDFLTQNM